jgi:drug/metabolite transporter (DMT)-like permease
VSTGHLRGIVTMLTAVGVFAVMDALLKVLAPHYPAMQVGALRGAASLPFMLVALLAMGRLRELKPVRWGLHLARGALVLVVMGGFVYAVRVLSLADAYAIFLAAPLIVTALSVPLLREHVGWRRWLAIGVGLSGVILMLRPQTESMLTLGALAALASATAYAASAITVRVLTRTDSTASIVFWVVVQLTVFAGLIAAPVWQPLRPQDWWPLAGIGLSGAIAQHLLTEAFRLAPASVIAPFEYTALLWGIAIDYVFWDTLPGSRVYLGGGIVIASGLYLIWRERWLAVTQRPWS